MKSLSKFFIGILAIWSLTGCDKDNLDSDDSGNNGLKDAVYMNVNVLLPSAAGLGRSSTEEGGGSSDGTEVGKDYENNVSNILLVLASSDDEYIAHDFVGGLLTTNKTSKPTVSATASISKTSLASYYQGQTLSEQQQKIHVYVFCNPTQELIQKLESASLGDKTWMDEICEVIDKKGGSGVRNTSIWSSNSFLMSNASVAEKKIPSTIEAWDSFDKASNPFDLSGSNNGGIDNVGSIRVERSVARFDFKDGSNGEKANTYDILTTVYDPETDQISQEASGLQVQLIRMGLVNMSKQFYYLRRVSNDGFAKNDNNDFAYCGSETPTNYVVDTDADFKKGSLNAEELSTHFNFPLFNSEGRINDATREQWDDYLLEDILGHEEDNDEGWMPENKRRKDYHIWRYVTENTIPSDEENQRSGISTGVVFKGKLLATDELTQKHKQLDIAIAGNYELPEGVDGYTYEVNGKVYPILYMFQERIYVGWNDEIVKFAKEYGTGSPLYMAVGIDDDTDNSPNKLYQDLVKAKGTNTEEAALAAFRKAATEAGFTLYQASEDKTSGGGYYFYYYYWNRHNDNGRYGTMGPMEFGVVRNNVYKLAVTEINKLGHPRISDNDPDPVEPENPDEDGDVYLRVSVEVLPWVVRVNDIVFN